MKKRRKRKKFIEGLFILLQLLLLCTGCGWQEYFREEPPEDKTDVKAAGVEDNVQIQEETVSQLPIMAPLLEWDEPEKENLAGNLQETCGGMMVRLTAGRYTGSGIIYDAEKDSIVIVTAAHVLADAEEGVKITFVDGWETETEEIAVSELADLAVIRVMLAEIPLQHLEQYLLANVDKSSYEELKTGDGCIVMGCRSGVAEDAYEGIVLEPWIYMEDYGQYMIWVKSAGVPGMSGGGLFDTRGRLLGILSGRSEDGEWAVVPLALVLAEL